MKTLILKKTASHYGGDWSDDDYVVLDGDKVIGRIMLHPQAPEGQPWFWTIIARIPQSTADRGYAASRESHTQRSLFFVPKLGIVPTELVGPAIPTGVGTDFSARGGPVERGGNSRLGPLPLALAANRKTALAVFPPKSD